jgi:hypothetical protein
MTLQGKGLIIYNLPECEAGEPGSILAAAQAAGLSHVLIKVADGEKAFGMDAAGGDQAAPVVQALQQAGIAVWGWHSVHGTDPDAEAAIAIMRSHILGLDGYVVCAADEFARPGMANTARQFMQVIRGALTVPIALSSYRFPNYHPEFPWSNFLEFCDVHMPQVTWEQAHNPAEQLRESKRQCDALPNAKPFIPTGPAYSISGWNPSAEEIIEFLNAAVQLGLPAINFYDWDDCHKDQPLLWTAIAEFPWPTSIKANPPVPSSNPQTTPVIPEVFLSQFVEALNSRQPAKVSALYDPAAIQVWADHILKGAEAIQSGYDAFFDSLPAGAVQCITQASMEGDACLFTWKVGPLTGETTLVIKNGKIILEYTFIYQPVNQN